MERVNEHLDAIRMADQNSYAAQVEIQKNCKSTPIPVRRRSIWLVHQQIIRDTQTILEGLPKPILRGIIPHKPTLDTILEVSSSAELESELQIPSILSEPKMVIPPTSYERKEESLTKSSFKDVIL